MHIALDAIGLILSSVALYFVIAARGGKLKLINRSIFFLSLDVGCDVLEDLLRWWKGIMFTPEGISLEILSLALTAMALYYVASGKYKEEKTPFNVASWCMAWVVLGEFSEFIFGLIMGE